MDKSTVHIGARWVAFVVLLALYTLRVFLVNGWYIVTYGLGIYILNNFISFLSPQVRRRRRVGCTNVGVFNPLEGGRWAWERRGALQALTPTLRKVHIESLGVGAGRAAFTSGGVL